MAILKRKSSKEEQTDIENSERRLSEMEKELNIVPDPNIRQKIRTMREKEKTRLFNPSMTSPIVFSSLIVGITALTFILEILSSLRLPLEQLR